LARPRVTAAFAISEDGCLARARGEQTLLSGPEAMELTHRLRAIHDAILVGIGTALCDDPALTTRLVEGPSPRRIVLDSELRLPSSARLLASNRLEGVAPPLVVGAIGAKPERVRALENAGAQVLLLPPGPGGVTLDALLSYLTRTGTRALMVEGGPRVLGTFFRADAVDQLCITRAPVRLDNSRAVKLSVADAERIDRWRPSVSRMLGDDALLAGPWEAP
jgi:riboflavin-specific deaminase-like protein